MKRLFLLCLAAWLCLSAPAAAVSPGAWAVLDQPAASAAPGVDHEVFSWAASTGDLTDAKGPYTGSCTRSTTALRISPDDGSVESVAIDTAVFEKPFDLSVTALRMFPSYTNELAALGNDTEGMSGWSAGEASVNADAASAPWSGHTGDGIIPSAAMNYHSMNTGIVGKVVSAAEGTHITASFFGKPGTSNYAALGIGVSSDASQPLSNQFSVPYILLNLSTGAVTASGDILGAGTAPVNAFCYETTGGWVFSGFEFDAPAGTDCVYVMAVAVDAAGNAIFSGDGVSDYSHWWGFTVAKEEWRQPYAPESTARGYDTVKWAMADAVAATLTSTGTLVCEIVPLVNQSEVTTACNLVSCDDGTISSLLGYASGNLVTYDGSVDVAEVTCAFEQGQRYLFSAQWDAAAGTKRVGYRTTSGSWTWGTPEPYDGSYEVGDWLHLAFNIDGVLPWYFIRLVIRDDIPAGMDSLYGF